MLATRVIPCLDFLDGRVVKGVKFQGLRDSGEPAPLAKRYEAEGADELVMLDVAATSEGRKNAAETVAKVRSVLSIPLTVGGGVRSVDDAARLMDAGADKLAANTAAVECNSLLSEIAGRFGAQCAVVAIDAAVHDDRWVVLTRSGTTVTELDAIEWAVKATELGAGEILLTSWDRDGTQSGYDNELIYAVASRVRVPVIASGGAANPQHMIEAIRAGASAVLAASILHTEQFSVSDIKRAMREANIEVRLR